MRPEGRDAAYLWDMLDSATTVREMMHGVVFAQYMSDRKLQLAVERSLEIIGEAARHVSTEFRQAHPEIPWRRIVGLRHVLAHEYGDIKQDRLWQVVSVRVPELIDLLRPLIPPAPPEPPTGQR